MTETYNQYKKRTGSEPFERMRHLLRYDLGEHKKTRLKKAGCGDSRTLLHNDVAAADAATLEAEYNRHCSGRFDETRLRYLTILHELVQLDIDKVIASCVDMKSTLERLFSDGRVWARGVIEVEMVNIEHLKSIQRQTENEKRKLTVVNDLIPLKELQGLMVRNATGTMALVHCHVLVDLGGAEAEREDAFRAEIKKTNSWNRVAYQVELKRTFKNRSLKKNLNGISKYATNGGNEQLRYKSGFGRDLAEDLEAKIWRAGTGRKDRGGDSIEDERGLTVGEVSFLDAVYQRLMKLRQDKRGYVVSHTYRGR